MGVSMFHNLMTWLSGMESHLGLLIILLFFSYIAYHYCFRYVYPAVGSGSIVMAIGVFLLYCMPRYDFWQVIVMMMSVELFIIWFFLTIGFMNSYLYGYLSFDFLYDRLNIGTWVAGTSVIVLILDEVEHTLHGFIVFLGIVAIILWVAYLNIILQWLSLNIKKRFSVPINGTILLATVSTQSIVLMLDALFHNTIPGWIYQLLIILGLLLYIIGFCSIVRYLFVNRKHHFFAVWANSNCIHYGALAITGFTMITLQAFPEWVITFVWWWSAVFFFIVELFEVIRLINRVKAKGIVKGIWVYDTSQWARNFTFGMFYAFTFLYYSQQHATNELVSMIANYGQYIVGLLLIIELILTVTSVIASNFELEEHRS